MIADCIKLFAIIYGYVYIFNKITYNSSRIFFSKLKELFIFLILTITSFTLNSYHQELSYFVPFLLFWIIVSYQTTQPQISFLATVLSFTISLATYGISCFLSLLILCTIFMDKSTFPFTLLAILSFILHNIMISALCKNKRFRKGMPFLNNSSILNIATFIALPLILCTIYFASSTPISGIRSIAFIILVLGLAFLIYWWQLQITKSYRQHLAERELESLRIENMELLAFNEKILKDNERLSTICHRDNTLIATMLTSNTTYFTTKFETEEERIATGERLVANLETLAEGRINLPSHNSNITAKVFDTGISLLDELLRYMDEEASKNNILFSVHSSIKLSEFVPKDISETELVHIIDDLLKNAFKATKTKERRMVQLQFYKLGKHFVVEVADNGIPFEIRSLVNMGIEQITTYEDGSGIGLMDIWNTKENLRATYHLEEYASPSPFTKRISLTFDKKNRYSIRTYRKDAIQKMSKRIDLQIYEKENKHEINGNH